MSLKPNEVIKMSLEGITGEKGKQLVQAQVPQQDEGESCGYRTLSYLNKVVNLKGQTIQQERAKCRNRLYY